MPINLFIGFYIYIFFCIGNSLIPIYMQLKAQNRECRNRDVITHRQKFMCSLHRNYQVSLLFCLCFRTASVSNCPLRIYGASNLKIRHECNNLPGKIDPKTPLRFLCIDMVIQNTVSSR